MEGIASMIHAAAVEFPDAPVLSWFADDEARAPVSRDRAALWRTGCGVARHLRGHARPGDRVLLVMPPGLEFVDALIGCIIAGVVPVPVFPPDPWAPEVEGLRRVAADCGATVALTTRAYATARLLGMGRGMLGGHRPEWPSLSWLTVDAVSPFDDEPPSFPSDTPALLQYTSGSTGHPRGVVLTHGNLAHQLTWTAGALGMNGDARLAFWVPPYHDLGLISGILTAAVGHGQALMMSPISFLRRPARWMEIASQWRATHLAGPDFGYDLVVRKTTADERRSWDLSAVRVLMSAGEPVRAAAARRLLTSLVLCGLRPSAFTPAYGLAEHAVGVSVGGRRVIRVARGPLEARGEVDVVAEADGHVLAPDAPCEVDRTVELVTCGRPGDGVEVIVVDPETRVVVGPGRVGELWVDSPSRAVGYWGRSDDAEVLRARLADGPPDLVQRHWLRTGDTGFLHRGEVVVCGRRKDVIILGGHNLYANDVEDTLREASALFRPGGIAVFGVRDDPADPGLVAERVVAVMELRDPGTSSVIVAEAVSGMHRAVQRRHGVAAQFVVVAPGSVPKTTSGKVQRWRCREALREGRLAVVNAGASGIPVHEASAMATTVAASGPLVDAVHRAVATVLGRPVGDVPIDRPLREIGASSMQLVEVADALEAALARPVPPALLFDAPTISALAQALASDANRRGASAGGAPWIGRPADEEADDAIAIVGIGCRFPGGVVDPDSFWRLLVDGVDAITEVPTDRWDLSRWYDPDPDAPGRISSRWGGFVEGIESFEPGFFGISPAEAPSVDPQERLLLETSWEALERAGIPQGALVDAPVGVYVGLSATDYQARVMGDSRRVGVWSLIGTSHAAIAGRLSYWLGLRGPNLAVDTACSSSLMAVHLACQALRAGDCTLALAGGANALVAPEASVALSRLHALSPTGRCRAFSDAADGYVRAEGAGVVVLERLADARRHGRPVLAVIRGSAVDHDGRSNGFTAPSGAAQRAVIEAALRRARLTPAQIDVVECHGTGTSLGDLVEATALGEVVGSWRDRAAPPVRIGSVKSNIGHAEAAAGIAGLIKLVLSLQHGFNPGTLHAGTVNPRVPWSEFGLEVASVGQAWTRQGRPRRGGVSSFGLSGTNVHVVVEEALVESGACPETVVSRPELITLSARTAPALAAAAERLASWLGEGQPSLSDVAATLAHHRTPQRHRVALVADCPSRAAELLREVAIGRTPPGVARAITRTGSLGAVAFVVSGQGAQVAGMGRALAARWSVYRSALDEACAVIDPHLPRPLRGVMFAEAGTADARWLDQTQYAQPALLACAWAAAALWRSWGVTPEMIAGHSVGEIIAACVAGALSLEDAARAVCTRGRILQALPPGGAMVSIAAPSSTVEEAIAGHSGVAIAAINGPRSVVLSGDEDAVLEIAAWFTARGAATRRLEVSHAFHSPRVDPALWDLTHALGDLTLRAPTCPIVSCLSGAVLEPSEVDPGWWARHARAPVRFLDAVRAMDASGARVWIELGPRSVLAGLIGGALTGPPPLVLAPSRAGAGEDVGQLEALGLWHARGGEVRWAGVYGRGLPLPLPTTPWQRERCWIEAATLGEEPDFVVEKQSPPMEPGQTLEERRNAVITAVVADVVQMTGRSADEIRATTRLDSLGLDSLTGLDLRTRVMNTWGVEVPFSIVWQELTLGDLASHIAERSLADTVH